MSSNFIKNFKKEAKQLKKLLKDYPYLQNHISKIVSDQHWADRMKLTDNFLSLAGQSIDPIDFKISKIIDDIEFAAGISFQENSSIKYNSQLIGYLEDSNNPIRAISKIESTDPPKIITDLASKYALHYGLENELENANFYSESIDGVFLHNATNLQNTYNAYKFLSFALLQRARGFNKKQHDFIEEIGIGDALGKYAEWLLNIENDATFVEPLQFKKNIEIEAILMDAYELNKKEAKTLNNLLCDLIAGYNSPPNTNKVYMLCKKMGYDYQKIKELAEWRTNSEEASDDVLANLAFSRSISEKSDLTSKILSFIQKSYLYSKTSYKEAYKRYDNIHKIPNRVFGALSVSTNSFLDTYEIEKKVRKLYSNESPELQDKMVEVALFG